MSFVGTRPEVTKYVQKYTKEMRARRIKFRTGRTASFKLKLILCYGELQKCGKYLYIVDLV